MTATRLRKLRRITAGVASLAAYGAGAGRITVPGLEHAICRFLPDVSTGEVRGWGRCAWDWLHRQCRLPLCVLRPICHCVWLCVAVCGCVCVCVWLCVCVCVSMVVQVTRLIGSLRFPEGSAISYEDFIAMVATTASIDPTDLCVALLCCAAACMGVAVLCCAVLCCAVLCCAAAGMGVAACIARPPVPDHCA